MAPPWHGWDCPPRIVVGENGSLLAVVVRDVFQEIDTAKLEDGMGSWREVLRQGQELAEKRGRNFWLDARLYRDGKWSEARALEDLLAGEREFLVKSFPGQTPDFSFFDMQVSGTELWWSDGTAVHALDADGRHAAWALPEGEDSSARGHLRSVNLLRLADGVIWCVDGANVYSLKCEKGRIEAAARPEAKLPGYPHWPNRHLYAVPSGSLWYWFSNTSGAGTWTLHEGTWEIPKGLGLFLREDSDGTLWFLPGGGEGSNSWKGYNLVSGDKRLRLPMPGDFPKGHVANVDKDKLLATGGDRVFLLVRTAEEPGWRVKDVVGLKETYENGPVWLDRQGNLVGQSGWSAKLPEDKFKDWSAAAAEK